MVSCLGLVGVGSPLCPVFDMSRNISGGKMGNLLSRPDNCGGNLVHEIKRRITSFLTEPVLIITLYSL